MIVKYLRMAAALVAAALLAARPVAAQDTLTELYSANLSATSSWTNAVSTYSAMASVPSYVHNAGMQPVQVAYTASGSAPTSAGVTLKPGETLRGNAANVWIRSPNGPQPVVVGLISAASPAGGNVASGATDSGNPVKVGGKYNATTPTLTDGQRGDVQLDSRGSIRVTLTGTDVTTTPQITTTSDAMSASIAGMATRGFNLVYNGTTWDRIRGDTNGISVLPGLSSTYWNYTSGTSPILSNTTTAVTIKAAAGASVRNFIDSCQLTTTAFGAAVPLAIRDGAGGTVLFALVVPTAGFLQPVDLQFRMPLRSTANTLLEVVTTTANTSGTVTLNCQGHTGS